MISIYICISISLSLYIYIYIYLCLSIYLSLSLYIYIYIQIVFLHLTNSIDRLFYAYPYYRDSIARDCMAAIFCPFSQFCEIGISLMSL